MCVLLYITLKQAFSIIPEVEHSGGSMMVRGSSYVFASQRPAILARIQQNQL